MEQKIPTVINEKPPFIEEGVFLSDYATFKIGGKADFFARVGTIQEAREAIQFAQANKLDVFFLGGGSNTVFKDDGHEGLVIKNELKGFEKIAETDSSVVLKIGSGEVWDEIVLNCVKNEWSGIENLTAIPGTLGGAVVQNIGAYGVEIKSVIESVDVLDPDTLEEKTLYPNDLKFGYRDSVFKQETHKNFFILSAHMVLRKNATPNISYKDLSQYFEGKNNADISAQDVREALLLIRGKKFPDLTKIGTAGSFFKNTIVDKNTFESIQKQYPDMPFFALENGEVKIPTGWILDKVCGLKGMRDGNLGLYENQSLVVVNFGNATSKDLKKFISEIKKISFEKIGIKLEEEVIVL